MNLQDSPLFAGLDPEKVRLVAANCSVRSYGKGDVVFREGESGQSFFVVMSGKMAVLKKMGASQRLLVALGPGDSFGEMALISAEKRSATLQALADSQCMEMDRGAFSQLVEENPLFAQQMLRIIIKRLRSSEERTNREILQAHHALIFSLAKLAESRDPYTGSHLYRVREYCVLLAQRLATLPQYRDTIHEDFIESLYATAPLHDIGKVAIPDHILLKAGELTEEEYRIMKTHPRIGAEALKMTLQFADTGMFQIAHNLTLWHHENYDGQGYPDGLAGEQIPLEAQIMAAADVYDALVSRRVYKMAYGKQEVLAALRAMASTRFSPDIADAVIRCMPSFDSVLRKYA